MKRCTWVFGVCLFCLVTGTTLHTAHAERDQTPFSPGVPLAFAVSFDITAATLPEQEKPAKPTKAVSGTSSCNSGWVSMDPGTRAAYVGIHGGTAPLSLFRASNGLLFAITGQTGNDFVYILRGGTVNGSAKQPQEQKGEDDVRTIVHGIASSNAQEKKPEQKKGVTPSTPNLAQDRHATRPAKGGAQSLSEQNGSTKTDAMTQPTPGKTSVLPSNKKPLNPAAGERASAGLPPEKNSEPENVSAAPAREKTLETIMSSLPRDHASIIFASGELASSINDAQGVLAPFGFPLPDENAMEQQAKAPSVTPKLRFAPVKLGDYRKVLAEEV